MSEPLRAESDKLTVNEIPGTFREGRRVVIQAELFGGIYEVAPRHNETVFYCDMPTTLHRREDEDGVCACVLRMGYVKEQRRCDSRS